MMFVCLFVTQLGIHVYVTYIEKLLRRNCVQWHNISSIVSTFHEMATHTIITMIFPNVLRHLMPYAYTLITENRDSFITYIIERFISNFNIIPTSCFHSLNPRLSKLCNPVYDKKNTRIRK